MENIKQLKTSTEIRTSICSLGDFVNRKINGYLELEFDLKNPCGDGDIVAYQLFPSGNQFKEAYLYNETVTIMYNDGSIVEIEASPRRYFKKSDIYDIVDKLYKQDELFAEESYIGAREIYKISLRSKSEIKGIIDEIYQQTHSEYKDFIIFNNELHYQRFDSKTIRTVNIKITEKPNASMLMNGIHKNPKIIQSNKFKTHMKVHEAEFSVSYTELIQHMKNSGKFNDLQDDFIEIVVEFPFYIGYSNLCETNENHTIVFAKRKDRELYTRFTLDGQKEKTNTCVVILRKSLINNNEYCMVTMFPGKYLIKEPQDKNFKSEKDRQAALKFWDNHALVFEPKTIDLESIRYLCPYSNKTISC